MDRQNREAKMKRLILIVFVIICVAYIFTILNVSTGDVNNPPTRTVGREDSGAKAETIKRAEAAIDEMLSEGLIYNYSASSHQVRMTPDLWLSLPLNTKQDAVKFWATYFELKTGLMYVEILSSQNDTVLGEFDVWKGVKIYY